MNGKAKVVAGTNLDRSIPHYVYRVYDTTDVLLYVGCSKNVAVRLEMHRVERAHWFHRLARVDVVAYPDFGLAAEDEGEAIWTESPVFNIRGRNLPWYECRNERATYFSAARTAT